MKQTSSHVGHEAWDGHLAQEVRCLTHGGDARVALVGDGRDDLGAILDAWVGHLELDKRVRVEGQLELGRVEALGLLLGLGLVGVSALLLGLLLGLLLALDSLGLASLGRLGLLSLGELGASPLAELAVPVDLEQFGAEKRHAVRVARLAVRRR